MHIRGAGKWRVNSGALLTPGLQRARHHPQSAHLKNPLSLWVQILRFQQRVSYGEAVVGESNQGTARLRGSSRGQREGGALSAVHGAGKNAASFHCNQRSGVEGRRETNNSCG